MAKTTTTDAKPVSERKPAHRVLVGDYVKLAGMEFERVASVERRADGFCLLRFASDYRVALPPDRTVETY